MSASRKDEPMAFMPSSNDTIGTSYDSNGHVSPRSSLSTHLEQESIQHSLLRNESAILSPSATPQVDTNMSYMSSGNDGLPFRASVPSASSLPHEMHGSPPNQAADWYSLYWQLNTHHTSIVQGLRQRIENLESELKKSRNDSGFGTYTWAENRNPSMSSGQLGSPAKSRLSGTSNGVSPHSERSSMTGTNGQRKTSDNLINGHSDQRHSSSNGTTTHQVSFATLTSIPEDGNAGQDGSEQDLQTMAGSSRMGFPMTDDDPLSPPTTAMIPTPPNLRTHAGRTPPDPAVMEERMANGPSNEPVARFEGSDDDPALNEPRIISNSSEVDLLHQKLQQVASDSDLSMPQAMKTEPYAEAGAESSTESGTQSAADSEGIILKRKQSTNFGVPFGMASFNVPRRE